MSPEQMAEKSPAGTGDSNGSKAQNLLPTGFLWKFPWKLCGIKTHLAQTTVVELGQDLDTAFSQTSSSYLGNLSWYSVFTQHLFYISKVQGGFGGYSRNSSQDLFQELLPGFIPGTPHGLRWNKSLNLSEMVETDWHNRSQDNSSQHGQNHLPFQSTQNPRNSAQNLRLKVTWTPRSLSCLSKHTQGWTQIHTRAARASRGEREERNKGLFQLGNGSLKQDLAPN